MMLELTGVHSGYGQIPILRDITLHVAEGEFVGILGDNGMGKTTLLMTIGGDLSTTQGRIGMEGRDITALPIHRRARLGLGHVKQGRRIFPQLTVRENMQAACLAGGQSLDRAEEMTALFPRLAPIAGRPGGVLSGGEQQILALARCLCAAPRLVMLDEPTEGLDVDTANALLRDLAAALGQRSLLMITHGELPAGVVHRSYRLQHGKLLEWVE